MPRTKPRVKPLKRKRPDFITKTSLVLDAIRAGDTTLLQYVHLLNMDFRTLQLGITSRRYAEAARRLLSMLIYQYPVIYHSMTQYITSGINPLRFLHSLSNEQIMYVASLTQGDTKLLACAGSGKTRSILYRIYFMVKHGIVSRREVFAVTFSRFAAQNFHTKIKELFPDYKNVFVMKNFSTIDSLAKSILSRLCFHKSENVEILSIAFRNYLCEMKDTEIAEIRKLKPITHLFVDEAQDLNQVQYDAIMLLKEKLKVIVHFVGDPNQNIYQFRRSNSCYLMDFRPETFSLTLNFRSSQQIIDFSEALKPVATLPSKSASNREGPKVTVITKTATDIHRFIVKYIKNYTGDISDIAIICPTRGIKAYNTVGLSVFFNLFKEANIPFNQLYDESGLNDERRSMSTHVEGHVNLLTYHGTKGLEFKVVFVMDFYQRLFNQQPSQREHEINRYLLYVACSRAIDEMYVCTYTSTHSGFLNHWLTLVDPKLYKTEGRLQMAVLDYRVEEDDPVAAITEVIGRLTDQQLNQFHDAIKIVEDMENPTIRIFPDFSDKIDRGKDETLFGLFCEELFYLQYYLHRQKPPRDLKMIQDLIASNIVIFDEREFNLLKKHVIDNKLSWDRYDELKFNLPTDVQQLIDKNFDRSNPLSNYTICPNSFIKIVNENLEDIRSTYLRYKEPTLYNYDYKEILTDLFYLVVVDYAYQINHYFYINNHGVDKHFLIDRGHALFREIVAYVVRAYGEREIQIKWVVQYDKLGLIGEIDFIELSPQMIVEIKCVKEINIRYYLQILIYNFCFHYENNRQRAIESGMIFGGKFKIINLLTGLEHHFTLSINPTNMFNAMIIMCEAGQLTYTNLNLIYDLETTDKFTEVGPIKDWRDRDSMRGRIFKKNGNYYLRQYPSIIEIAIKDYDTDMVLLNNLVFTAVPMHPEVVRMTGLDNQMLANQKNIVEIKAVLQHKMARFTNCQMLSHNGKIFDDLIVEYDGLIDTTRVTFIDTMQLIPIHYALLPGKGADAKLEGKSLDVIYQAVIGKRHQGHRAMADVDALIEIMRKLGIGL